MRLDPKGYRIVSQTTARSTLDAASIMPKLMIQRRRKTKSVVVMISSETQDRVAAGSSLWTV
jgi:hypothetical protein